MFPESEYSGSIATECSEFNRLTNGTKSDKSLTQFPKPDCLVLSLKLLYLTDLSLDFKSQPSSLKIPLTYF